MRICPLAVSLRSLLGLCVVAIASATTAAEPSVPKCALIDVGQSPLAALVEARLLERENTEWLERNQVEQLLAEQHLQALFAADATAARAAIGRILKADLLVVLRTGEREKQGERQKQKYAELVVAETSGGLRLIARQVPLGDDAEADVETLVALVDQALAKHREKITAIYAVPPFVSQDLTYEHDYLKTAYARLLEQVFLEQPGVLVVEFAEAESFVREFQLAAPDQRLERRLPVYLLGEYRHEGRDDEQTVTVSLQVKSGDTVIETHKRTLGLQETPAFLRRTAGNLLQSDRRESAIVAPGVEARKVAERATTFFDLGEWEEALSLMEASLLLDPDQPKLRRSAHRAARRLADVCGWLQEESYAERLRLQCRALEHFREFALNSETTLALQDAYLFQSFPFSHLRADIPLTTIPDSLAPQYEKYVDERRALAMQLVHHLAEQGEWKLSATFLDHAVAGMEPKQRYAEKIKTILRYQDRPGAKIAVYVHNDSAVEVLNTIEGRRFLQQLRTAPEANAVVRNTAETLQAALDARLAAAAEHVAALKKNSSPETSRLTFQPMDLYAIEDGKPERKVNALFGPSGYFPLQDDIDLFWTRWGNLTQVFAIKQRGQARLLWERPGTDASVVHDGRYLWLTCLHRPAGSPPSATELELWVLDPVQEKAWQLGREHGLPLFRQDELPPQQPYIAPNAVIAPIAPGEVIVAGWIGRTWLAHVVFDPQEQHRVKIFHEARDRPPSAAAVSATLERWKSSTVVFRPHYAFTVSEPQDAGKVNQRVLIGRSDLDLSRYPLVIDPSDLSVSVLEPGRIPLIVDRGSMFGGALYYVFPPGHDQLDLFRMGLPDLQPVPVLSDVKEGIVLFDGETVNLVGAEWWRGPLRDGRLESFGAVPWYFQPRQLMPSRLIRPVKPGDLENRLMAPSNHYGIIVFFGEKEGRSGVARVVFDGSGMSMKEVLDHHHQDVRAATSVSSNLPAARPVPEPADNLWQTKELVTTVAWSPDGKTIVTADRSVRAWNAEDGRLIADYPVSMNTVIFSPSGRYFATATHSNSGPTGKAQIMLWSTQELKPLHRLECHAPLIDSLAFSWDDQWLASACRQDVVRVWNVRTGEQHLKLERGTDWNRWLGFTPDSKRLVVRRTSETQYWDLSSGEPGETIESVDYVAGFLPDKRILAVTRNIDNSLIAWDCTDDSSGRLWDRTPGLPIAVSPDGRRLVTGVKQRFVDGEVKQFLQLRVWDLATGRELLKQDSSTTAVPSIAFSPDGNVLIVVQSGRLVRHELE